MGIKSIDLLPHVRQQVDPIPTKPPRLPRGKGKRGLAKAQACAAARASLRVRAGAVVSEDIPLKVVTESNAKEKWQAKAGRARQQRKRVRGYLAGKAFPPLPATVTMTRISAGEMDDDNLASAFKHVRDAIAEMYGVDDRSKAYTWLPRQQKGPRGESRIHIRIEPSAVDSAPPPTGAASAAGESAVVNRSSAGSDGNRRV